ncbi:hypothetical protein D3C78_847570 [compost metagenome]
MTKTFSWLVKCLLQNCGQVNNYARTGVRAQRKFTPESMDALAHPLNTKAWRILRADTPAVVRDFQMQPVFLLAKDDGHFAGIGVFTDVIQQFL